MFEPWKLGEEDQIEVTFFSKREHNTETTTLAKTVWKEILGFFALREASFWRKLYEAKFILFLFFLELRFYIASRLTEKSRPQ